MVEVNSNSSIVFMVKSANFLNLLILGELTMVFEFVSFPSVSSILVKEGFVAKTFKVELFTGINFNFDSFETDVFTTFVIILSIISWTNSSGPMYFFNISNLLIFGISLFFSFFSSSIFFFFSSSSFFFLSSSSSFLINSRKSNLPKVLDLNLFNFLFIFFFDTGLFIRLLLLGLILFFEGISFGFGDSI